MITARQIGRFVSICGLLAVVVWLWPLWRSGGDPVVRLTCFHLVVFAWAAGAWIPRLWALWIYVFLSLAIPGFVALAIIPLGFHEMSGGDLIVTLLVWELFPAIYATFLWVYRAEWKTSAGINTAP
jgi:hypothetical protein